MKKLFEIAFLLCTIAMWSCSSLPGGSGADDSRLEFCENRGPQEARQRLQERGLDYQSDTDVRTVLHEGDSTALCLFLQAGMDPDRRVEGSTFLHAASMAGDTRMARILLNDGADPDIQAVGQMAGMTPLHLTAFRSKRMSGDGPRRPHPEVAKILLEHGADPNIQDRLGSTPLHVAVAFSQSPRLVEILVEYGADPTIETSRGRTALEALRDSGGNAGGPSEIDQETFEAMERLLKEALEEA